MRKLLIALSILTTFAVSGFGWVEEIEGSWGQAGLTKLTSTSSQMEVNLSLGSFGLEDFAYDGNNYQSIITRGVFLPADQGNPDFPSYSQMIAIPNGATASIEVVDYRSQVYHQVVPRPAPDIPMETDDRPLSFQENPKVYSSSEIYPREIALISSPADMRGLQVVNFAVIPFQWDPVSQDLTVYTDVRVRITINGGTGYYGQERLRSPNWDQIYQRLLMNPEVLPEVDYSRRVEMKLAGGRDNAEFVIICPNQADFIAWADSIALFRSEQGVISEVFTLTDIGGTSATQIENWIDNAYNTWTIPPEAILFLGDYPQITSPMWNSYCVSDNIYASVSSNGNGDSLPDLITGRICAQNATQLNDMITKDFIYERTPPTDAGFYDHPTAACGYQTERWFQIAAETVRGFWANNLGKNPVRVYATYSGSPSPGGSWSTNANTSIILNYFVPLGYIDPTIPAGINWNATKQDMLNTINNGTFIIQHRDHGSHSGWGEPDFQSGDISSCTNTATIWPFCYSTNCLTGEYNTGDPCFTEVFHRAAGKGFLGLNAASEVSYSFVNDTYIWGNYDYMWPWFMPDYSGAGGWSQPDTHDVRPGIAMPYAKWFLAGSSWPYNPQDKDVTYQLFHHHGDPYMRLYSNVPQTMSATHPPTITAGLNVFPVSAPVYTQIALTVDGEIIGRAEGTGSTVNVSIDPQNPGTTVKLVITGQDYYIYDDDLDVVPSTGAYVAYAYTDTITGGYDNGQINAGCIYDLTAAVANWGGDMAYGVEGILTSTDGYIIIDYDTVDYGNIAANDTVVGTTGYGFDIANAVPDGYVIPIEMVCWDNNDSTWNSSFNLTVKAPDLSLINIGGPDQVLPGDNFSLSPVFENEGQGYGYNLSLILRTTDAYVTITDSTASFSDIDPGEVLFMQEIFSVSVSSSCPQPHFVDFEIEVQVDGGYTFADSFTMGVGSVVFAEDFESGGTGWSYSGSSSWHLTTHDSHSSTHSMYCGQENSWEYSNNITDSRTYTPQLTVGAGVEMTFWHRYDIETSWDGAQMQMSTNGGSTWTTIEPDEGYTGTNNYGYGGYSPGDPIWTGHNHTTWEEQHYTFTSGGDVNICWRFGSDGSVTYEGYYFDDVVIGVQSGFSGVEEEQNGPPSVNSYQFRLSPAYPNPVRGRAVISYSVGAEGPVSLKVYDLTGREITTLINQVQGPGNYRVEWDGRDRHGTMVSSGTYFYRMTAGNFSDGKKLVVVR